MRDLWNRIEKKTHLLLMCLTLLILVGITCLWSMEKQPTTGEAASMEKQPTTGEAASMEKQPTTGEAASMEEQPTTGDAASMEKQPVEEMVRNSIVAVFCEETAGSGILYAMDANEVIVLTAAHVLDENQTNIYISFMDQKPIRVEEVLLDSKRDLAFLKLHCNLPQEAALVSICKEAYDNLEVGDSILVSGYLPGMKYSENSGKIKQVHIYAEELEQYVIETDAQADFGMSGGALFTDQKELVGVLTAIDGYNNCVAIPMVSVEAAAIQLGICAPATY